MGEKIWESFERQCIEWERVCVNRLIPVAGALMPSLATQYKCSASLEALQAPSLEAPPGSLLRLSVSNEPLCRKSGYQVTWSPPPWVVINWWSRRSWSRWSRRRNHEDLSLVCHQQPGHNCTRGRRKRSFLILTSPRKLSPVTNTNIILKIDL